MWPAMLLLAFVLTVSYFLLKNFMAGDGEHTEVKYYKKKRHQK